MSGKCVLVFPTIMIWLTILIYQLILCDYVIRSVRSSWRSKRTFLGTDLPCPRGCTACSRVNGCITCAGRLYLLLTRNNSRETGSCTHICPEGYFGYRHAYYNKCYRCVIANCSSCFSQRFCTVCHAPYLINEGECIERCPTGLYHATYNRGCFDRVDCLLGPWSPWSVCMRNGQTCGFTWGNKTRTKEIMQEASPNGTPCTERTATQRCRPQRRYCN